MIMAGDTFDQKRFPSTNCMCRNFMQFDARGIIIVFSLTALLCVDQGSLTPRRAI